MTILDLSEGAELTYRVPGRCSNCGWQDAIVLPRGRPAPKVRNAYEAAAVECPTCGNYSVLAAPPGRK